MKKAHAKVYSKKRGSKRFGGDLSGPSRGAQLLRADDSDEDSFRDNDLDELDDIQVVNAMDRQARIGVVISTSFQYHETRLEAKN